MGDDFDEFLAWPVVFIAVVAGIAWLIALLWKVILVGLLLWGIATLAMSEWRNSELRRRVAHRRRMASIDRIRRDTIASMTKEAQRVQQ